MLSISLEAEADAVALFLEEEEVLVESLGLEANVPPAVAAVPVACCRILYGFGNLMVDGM